MRGLTVLAATAVLLAACGRGEEASAPEAAPRAPAAAPETGVLLSARPEQREFRDWRTACDNGAA